MINGVIITTPQELQTLITDAVNVAVQQFSLPQKIEPLPTSNYLSIEQAGQFLNLAKQTVYGHVCNRSIPFIKKGKKLYFIKSELENWLNEGKKSTKLEILKNLKVLNDRKI